MRPDISAGRRSFWQLSADKWTLEWAPGLVGTRGAKFAWASGARQARFRSSCHYVLAPAHLFRFCLVSLHVDLMAPFPFFAPATSRLHYYWRPCWPLFVRQAGPPLRPAHWWAWASQARSQARPSIEIGRPVRGHQIIGKLLA